MSVGWAMNEKAAMQTHTCVDHWEVGSAPKGDAARNQPPPQHGKLRV